MKYLQINTSTTLSELTNLIGIHNAEYLLSANNLEWIPYIGRRFQEMQNEAMKNSEDVTWQRKSTILNTLTDNSDVFEVASLLSESGWKVLSALATLPNTLRIPESIEITPAFDIIGDGIAVGKTIYEKAMYGLSNPPHAIDPSIFNEYSTIKSSQIVDSSTYTTSDVFEYFRIPWGDVTLYASLDGSSIDFPVYPEELEDGRSANYSTMPDMIYQYEPWYVYNSSGPRTVPITFKFHRDMWTGDHSDGKANELIRFCEANCYPEFNGSAVNVSKVTLYIKGYAFITGILTDVTVKWDGPILNDGWYAHCELGLNITEISKKALTFSSVKSMPLIG